MASKVHKTSQHQGIENEAFKGAKGDFELWNRFEMINSTLSKHIDHLKEYRQIFSNYQNQILQSTNQSAKSISDRVCKLVEETIQQVVYNKIENSWKARIQISHEKCFSEIFQNLQKTFGSIEELAKQNNPYTSLNIISIRGLFDNQLSQVNRGLRNIKEDELITLQLQIDDHFKKYVQLIQKSDSMAPTPQAQGQNNDQLSSSNLKENQDNNQATTDNGSQNASTQGLSTNENDDDVGFSKKTDKKDNKNIDQNQSGILKKIKSIFKKEENRPSQVNLEGVSNDFRYCPIKKQWIFEGQEENGVLDEPPPIIAAANNQNSDSAQNIGGAADSSISNIGSGTQTPNQQYDAKSALTRPVNYRNARDMKNKAKEKPKARAAVNFMQMQKAEDSGSNFDSTTNNFDGTQQNLQAIYDSNNQLPSEIALGMVVSNFATTTTTETQQVNISDIIDRLNSQIVAIIEDCTSEALQNVPNVDFEEIEARFNEKTQQNGQRICKELQGEIVKLQNSSSQRFRRMQISYESQIKQLTRDYMDLMDESFAREKQISTSLHDDESLNSTIDSSVMEFCNKQSEKIKSLQAELLKKQCLMGKQDNKNMEIIKNMVEKITQLESKLLRYTDMEIENENLLQINSQLQKLSKQSQEQAQKVFGIKHQNMQSITTINQQLAEQIHSRQLLIDTLHQEITQKNRAIHELQTKNTNLQNISYDKEERINELQNILDQKEAELNDLIKMESLLKEDIVRLKDALIIVQDELNEKINNHINDITQLQEKNENYEQIEQNMNEELVNLQLEFNNYREETDQKIEQLNHDIEEASQQKESLQSQIDKVNEEKENLTHERDQLTEERDNLIQEKEILLQDKEVLVQEKENLNGEIIVLQEQLEQQRIAFDKEISSFEELITALLENGQQTEDDNTGIQQPKLIQLISLFSNKMKDVQSQKEEMEEELKYLNQDIENEKITVEQLQQECDSLAEQKDQLTTDYQNIINEKQQIQEQYEEKSKLLEEISEKLEKEQNKQNEFQSYENLIQEKEASIAELEKKLEAVNENTQQVNKALNEKEEILEQKEETIKILSESVQNYQIQYNTKVSELQEIHEMIAQLQNEIKQKEIQILEEQQLNEQLSIQYQELNNQHENLIFQNNSNFSKVEILSQQNEALTLEKNNLSHTLYSNQELIESYKIKLEEFSYTIADYEKRITDLNQTANQLDLLCQQKENEILSLKTFEERISNNQLIDKEEYDKKEKELREKIENLSKEIQELNRQNDEQTNEFANKIIILESSNTDLNDQMEQIRNDKDRQIQLFKEKYQQLENEYRGQIEDLQSQLKWDKQMNEDSEPTSNKRIDDNNDINDNSEGNIRSNNSNNQQNLDSKQELDSYKEKIDILEVQIIKLKNELQTSNNTNTIIERQIKSLHQSNENFTKEIDSLLMKLENEAKKYINLQKETDEQIESITNEKRHLKMNFDELLEKMNDSENFEKLSKLQHEIDSLRQEREQLLLKLQTPQTNQKIQSQSAQQHNNNQVQQGLQQQPQVGQYKKSASEELHEISLTENNSDILKSPIVPKLDTQPPQISSQTQLDKEQKKGGGFLNALAGIFLTEKDRKMLEQQKQ